VAQPSPQPNLDVVLGGAAEHFSLEMLRHDDFRRLLDIFRESYDIILLDSPAANPVSDALYLVRLADSAVVVIRSELAHKEDLTMMRRRMEQHWDKVVGCVLNGASAAVAGYYYYRYYGSQYRQYQRRSHTETR
jgi:tyrosine-protein kinase Etk/Wzc